MRHAFGFARLVECITDFAHALISLLVKRGDGGCIGDIDGS